MSSFYKSNRRNQQTSYMICVTGNNGFIGKALQAELENQGHKVKGLEKWIYERVRWQDRLVEYLHDMQPEAVFHVGACSDTQNKDVNEMMILNVHSTNIIADWCKYKKIPMIYSSSASIYGTKGTPNTLYSWSKFLGEEFVIKSGGVALRYFNVYGPGELHKGNMASMAHQAYRKHAIGEPIRLFKGNPMRDFVYVEDVVSANIQALNTYSDVKGGTYDVGVGEARTFEDMMNIMNIPFEYAYQFEVPENYQTFTEADKKRFVPGWIPEYNLEKGLNEYMKLLSLSSVHI